MLLRGHNQCSAGAAPFSGGWWEQREGQKARASRSGKAPGERAGLGVQKERPEEGPACQAEL